MDLPVKASDIFREYSQPDGNFTGSMMYALALAALQETFGGHNPSPEYTTVKLMLEATVSNDSFWSPERQHLDQPHHSDLISHVDRLPIDDATKQDFFCALVQLHAPTCGLSALRHDMSLDPRLPWRTLADRAMAEIFAAYNPATPHLSFQDPDDVPLNRPG